MSKYKFERISLGQRSVLASALAARIDEVQDYAERLCCLMADASELPEHFQEYRAALGYDIGMRRAGILHAGYTVPYLHPLWAEELSRHCAGLPYEVNSAEEQAYQMRECVLSVHAKAVHTSLAAMYQQVLVPLWVIFMGVRPEEIASLQVAEYTPEMAQTKWHYDEDSACTTTVALSSGYTGGGMDLFPGVEVERTAPGVATLFHGLTTLHRSRPVTEGTRRILVHWAN